MAIEQTTTTTIVHPTSYTSIGLLMLRLPLAAVFIFAAVTKMRNGIGAFVEEQLPKATKFMSENFARTYLGSLTWVELTVGVLLAIGLLTRATALIVALMLASFMIAATGVKGMPFHPNVFYLCVALAILLIGPGWLSVDGLLFRPRRRVVMVEPDDRVAP